MNLNGKEYFYIRNVQNDVIGLHDSEGKVVVSYSYDTWGNIVSISGSLKDSVGKKNPYRYRGYRYDEETGLYYLQSRYYNAEWGRFINCDNIGGKIGELGTHNAFQYCFNNPVNMSDESGQWPKWMKKVAKTVKKTVSKVGKVVKKTISKVGKVVKNTVSKIGNTVKNVIKTKINSSPICNTNKRGTVTIPIISGSIKGGLSLGGSIGVTIDTKGNISLQATGNFGGSAGLPSASVGVGSPVVTNAPSYKRLEGWGVQVGGSAQLTPFSADLDYSIIPNGRGGAYSGVGLKIGAGVTPLLVGGEVHAEATYTKTLGVVNLYDGSIRIMP